jgi:hypothetical protein
MIEKDYDFTHQWLLGQLTDAVCRVLSVRCAYIDVLYRLCSGSEMKHRSISTFKDKGYIYRRALYLT